MQLATLMKSGPTQISYVTNDLLQAMEYLKGLFPVSHFFQAQGAEPQNQRFRGEPAAVKMNVALAWTGNLFLEIIQPLTPDSLYATAGKAEGLSVAFHHLCFYVEDWDELLLQLERENETLVYSAEAEGISRYGYWDGQVALGHYVEFIALTDQGKAFMERIKKGEI